LNGAGHVVRNPAITGEHDLGLIGTLEMSGRVVDLGLVDANVISDGYCAGVLVGANYGCIARCFSTGAIAGNENVGGLIGRNGIHTAPEDHDALVIDCYSQCQVSGTNYVGGLVGWNYRGDVVHSYSTGRTQQEEVDPSPRGGTNRTAGGLVGYDMGEVLDSYWDIETSGQNASAGGTGLTTAEMMTAAPFLEAGWDFVGEDENGTDDLWWIDEGRGYPRLWWEGDGAEF